jgi:hypothetical protein
MQRICDILHDIRMVYKARQVVAAMDQIQLYSEKVRRTSLRVRIRSNYHLKRLGLRMLRTYV